MAPHTSIRGVVIIAVVTSGAIISNYGMSTVQGVIIIVNRECGRSPARSGCVAHRAVCRDIKRNVIWVGSLVEIRGVAC